MVGCREMRRCLSFLPAALVVYLLLHYIVGLYDSDLQTMQQSQPFEDLGRAANRSQAANSREPFLTEDPFGTSVPVLDAASTEMIYKTLVVPDTKGFSQTESMSPNTVNGFDHTLQDVSSPNERDTLPSQSSTGSQNGVNKDAFINNGRYTDDNNNIVDSIYDTQAKSVRAELPEQSQDLRKDLFTHTGTMAELDSLNKERVSNSKISANAKFNEFPVEYYAKPKQSENDGGKDSFLDNNIPVGYVSPENKDRNSFEETVKEAEVRVGGSEPAVQVPVDGGVQLPVQIDGNSSPDVGQNVPREINERVPQGVVSDQDLSLQKGPQPNNSLAPAEISEKQKSKEVAESKPQPPVNEETEPVDKKVEETPKEAVKVAAPVAAAVTPKATTVKKKLMPPSITFLKGPYTIGSKYEAGFSTPHAELCANNGRDLKLLILITTAPDHERHRNAVRQTWGHFAMRKDIAMGFVVGRTFKTEVQAMIDRENDRYGDIIEANFVDHYSNLTLKSVSMFEWTKTHCSEVKFILKTDDDMFINVPLLLAFMNMKKDQHRVMFGRLAVKWRPVRNTRSKYYVSAKTYRSKVYPQFLTGPAYLFTNDVVDDVYNKALSSTFFFLEDVLLTGFVSESLGIKRVGDAHFRNSKIKLTDTCKLMQSISIHMVKYEEQFDIYKRTLDGMSKCKVR